MNKHGFTLIEIIIVIALISIIGVGSFVGVKTIQKNKDELKEITNRIIESASVYIENEKDTNGNYYINGINEGGQGLILPLDTLYDEGYIKESDYKYVIKKVSNEKRYVVIGYKTEDECKTGGITIDVNWNDKEVVTTPLYLCSYSKKEESIKDNTILNVLLRDNKLNLGIPDLSNYKGEDAGLYILPDDDGSSFYFYGKVKNNYIKFNDMMWRIVRINGNGSTRIVLDDVIPYKLQKGEIISTSYAYGLAQSSRVSPISEYYDTYEKNIICFQTGSGTWSLTCFYDYDDFEQISKGPPFTYKLKEGYKVVANNNLEENLPDSIYNSTKYNILEDFVNTLKDISKIKKDDTYFINNDYIYKKRDFTFEDNKNSPGTFTNGIQTISYKELKYSGESNSYLTDTSKNFYTSDYYANGYYYYYYYAENKISTGRELSLYSICIQNYYIHCKKSASLQYPDGTQFAFSSRYYTLNVHGFKPVVNLLKDTCFKGNGTIDNPYEISECN